MKVIQVFVLFLAFLLFAACNQQAIPTETNQLSDAPTVFTESSSFSSADSKTRARPTLTPENAAKLQIKNVIIQHMFSDGTKVKFKNGIEGYAMHNGDEAIMKTNLLPAYIDKLEEELAKAQASGKTNTKTGTRSIGLNMAGCSGWFLWWCVNPTSNYFWSQSTIPYGYDDTVNASQKALIEASIVRWNATPGLNVKLKPAGTFSTPNRPIWFGIDYGTTACGYAMIGYQGWIVTGVFVSDFIHLNPNCLTNRTIHHEMGHKLGLPHEQSRCDRGQFLTYVPSGGIWDDAYCGNDYRTYTSFDFSSIMLYDTRFWKPIVNSSGTYSGNSSYVGNPYTTDYNYSLSPNDISTINQMYAGR